jgi:hypothetical protein
MRADQLDAARGETLPQGIAVGCSIVDQPLGEVLRDGLIEQRLDKSDLCGARAVDVDANGRPAPSTKSISFVPLPRFVGPIRSPLFCRGERTIGESFLPIYFALAIQLVDESAPRLVP